MKSGRAGLDAEDLAGPLDVGDVHDDRDAAALAGQGAVAVLDVDAFVPELGRQLGQGAGPVFEVDPQDVAQLGRVVQLGQELDGLVELLDDELGRVMEDADGVDVISFSARKLQRSPSWDGLFSRMT